MKTSLRILLIFISLFLFRTSAIACSPLTVPSLTSQSLVGNNLVLDWTSTNVWTCNGFFVAVEFACASGAFTGTGTPAYYPSASINKTSTPFPYPTQNIDISTLCSGTTYIFRAREVNAGGTFSPWTSTYTFTTPGTFISPTISVTGTPASICPPASAQLNATITNTCGSTPIYSWTPTTGLSDPSIANPVASPIVATTYTCTITGEALGCWSVSGSVTISITAPPVAGTASVSPVTMCNGNVATLTLTGSSGTIQWQASDLSGGPWTNIPGATTTPFVTPSLPGNICFQAVVTGCTSSNSNEVCVIVNPLPTATITGTTAVCQNTASPNVTITGASGTAPYTFTYTIDGGGNQTATTIIGNSVTFSVPTSIAGIVTYTLVSVQDASSTTCSQIQNGSAIITVNPLPNATISGTVSVCKGAALPNIAFTGAAGTAPYTFTYSINGGSNLTVTTTIGNSVNVSVPTSVAGVFIYTLVSILDASSTTCSQAQSGNATITVNPLPTATIFGTTSVCRNATAPNITFAGAAGSPPYTFTYKINNGSNLTVTTTSGSSVMVSAPTGTAGTFIYDLVSIQDASSTTCSQSQAGSATIMVNQLPTAIITGTIAVCKDVAAPNITFTGAAGTAPYTFTYTINGGVNQTVVTTGGNIVTVAVPTSVTGTFIYALVSIQDASSTTCSQSQSGSASVTVNPLPTATIAGTIIVCKNATDPIITFTGAAGTAPYTFTYSLNGVTQPTVSTIIGNSINIAASTTATGTFVYSLLSVQDASSTTCSQSQIGSATITVKPLPTATITGTITICKNDTVPDITFTGAGATAPYTFTYTINGGTNQMVSTTSGNSVTVSAPTGIAGTFIYDLVSVKDASVAACTQIQSGNATVTVNPLPNATIAGTVSVCEGASPPNITFTGANGTAPYTFTYSINGVTQPTVTSIGNGVTVSVPTLVAGTFTYSLLSVQDASSTLCSQTQSGSAIVKVNLLPAAIITGTTAVCRNAVLPYITFIGGIATAPYTFTYTINGGANQTVTTAGGDSVTVPAPTGIVGTFVYDLVSVHDASLTACVQAQTGSATVTINPLPVADFGFEDVCLTKTMNFYDSSAVSSGTNVGWSWNFGNSSLFDINQNTDYVYTDTGTYNVFLVVNTNNGCKDTVSKSVVVHPNPDTKYAAPNVCDGTSVQFNDLSSIPSPCMIQSWSWNFGDGSSLDTNQLVVGGHLYAGAGSFSVTLLTVSNFGCADSTIQTVVINPNPVVSFSANDTLGCELLCLSFQDNSVISSGTNVFWKWNIGDGSAVINSENFDHCYLNDSVYAPNFFNVTLTVTSDSGCVSILSKDNYITVFPKPIANFTTQPETSTIIDPVISLLDASSGADFWSWNFGDLDTSSGSNPLPHAYGNTGTYTIMLVASTQYGCVDTAYQTITIEPDFAFFIPNIFTPNGDFLNETFSGKGGVIIKYEMMIFDRWGNLTFFTDDINKPWDGTANYGKELAQEDVYIYSISLTDYNRKKHSYKGIVSLVR